MSFFFLGSGVCILDSPLSSTGIVFDYTLPRGGILTLGVSRFLSILLLLRYPHLRILYCSWFNICVFFGGGARGLSVLDLHYVLPGIASGTGENIRSWTEQDLEEGALGGLVHLAVGFIVLIYLSLWLCCPLLTISISQFHLSICILSVLFFLLLF